MNRLRKDAIIARILRETRIESGLDISEDIISEIVFSQIQTVKERMVVKLETTMPSLGTWRIKPFREIYHNNYVKLKSENPDLSEFELKKLNRAQLNPVVMKVRSKKAKWLISSVSMEKVTLIKKDG